MSVEEIFDHLPFTNHLDISVTHADEGYAEGNLKLDSDKHSSNPRRMIAHGAVPFALADTVGGAAVVSLNQAPAPTVDMRIDYIKPATSDLYAEANVERFGDSSAVVDIEVLDDEYIEVAKVRGVYKVSGFKEDSPHKWHEKDIEDAGIDLDR
ncbi:MAG: PaaI family thioesterase [Halobacteria archaeon]